MTIQDREAFFSNLWDWAILDGCFADSGIKPTDIDGFVERKGRFLILETKAPTTDLANGQRWAFEGLVKTGAFTIVIIWGHKNAPERLSMWTLHKGCVKRRKYPQANLEKLREVVTWWYDKANNGERP